MSAPTGGSQFPGYKRSTSVSEIIDLFEQRARTVSNSSTRSSSGASFRSTSISHLRIPSGTYDNDSVRSAGAADSRGYSPKDHISPTATPRKQPTTTTTTTITSPTGTHAEPSPHAGPSRQRRPSRDREGEGEYRQDLPPSRPRVTVDTDHRGQSLAPHRGSPTADRLSPVKHSSHRQVDRDPSRKAGSPVNRSTNIGLGTPSRLPRPSPHHPRSLTPSRQGSTDSNASSIASRTGLGLLDRTPRSSSASSHHSEPVVSLRRESESATFNNRRASNRAPLSSQRVASARSESRSFDEAPRRRVSEAAAGTSRTNPPPSKLPPSNLRRSSTTVDRSADAGPSRPGPRTTRVPPSRSAMLPEESAGRATRHARPSGSSPRNRPTKIPSNRGPFPSSPITPTTQTNFDPPSPRTPALPIVSISHPTPVSPGVRMPSPRRSSPASGRGSASSPKTSSASQSASGSRRTSYRLSAALDLDSPLSTPTDGASHGTAAAQDKNKRAANRSASQPQSAAEESQAVYSLNSPADGMQPIPTFGSDTPTSLSAKRAEDSVTLGGVVSKDGSRFDRKAPGLSLGPITRPSGPVSDARPSPPVPSKSPLRRQSGATSPRTVSRNASSVYLDSVSRTSATSLHAQSESDAMSRTPPRSTPDKRLTAMTQDSAYSQESAPPSAPPSAGLAPLDGLQPQSATSSTSEGSTEQKGQRQSKMNDLWGKSATRRLAPHSPETESLMALRLTVPEAIISEISTESPAAMSSTTPTAPFLRPAPTMPSTSPASEASSKHSRSPSAPTTMSTVTNVPPAKAAKLLGIQPQSPHRPDQLLQSPIQVFGSGSSIPPSPSPSASGVTKRTHLIREIATTERAYATDLALVRDAYLAHYHRPRSTASGEAGSSSYVSSIHGADKRLSGADWGLPVTTPTSPLWLPTASEGSQSGYFTPSINNTPASILTPSSASSKSSLAPGTMAPPVGRPLAPADIRAVFLNLDQLVAGVEELAAAFEAAVGDGASAAGATVEASPLRDGEAGDDRLGQVFVTMMPRLRLIYNQYCARQQSASKRLQELLADPAHAAHLDDCWRRIKDKTHAWNLDSMLIKPVQRITKYPLLFDDLLACTTPVHPDYFNIRTASEMARSIATEIDEAKRRKDVVASAISSRKAQPTSPAKETKKGIKLFGKAKSTPVTKSTITKSASAPMSLASETKPTEIKKSSFADLKTLVNRVGQAEQTAKSIDKQVVAWTAAAKETLVAQGQLLQTWGRIVILDGAVNNGANPPLALLRVIDDLIANAWTALNNQVQYQVLSIFAKLFDTTRNPRKVIAKHDAKLPDYARYFALVKSRKHVDPVLVKSARDFCALHTQLVDELPAFLRGFSRILDTGIAAFARVQAEYLDKVRVAIGKYDKDWISRSADTRAEHLSAESIVATWRSSWQPTDQSVEKLKCLQQGLSTYPTPLPKTTPSKVRSGLSRAASFNVGGRGSAASSRTGSPSRHKHSASLSSRQSSVSSLHTEGSSRTRSNTMLNASTWSSGVKPLTSPAKDSSRFNLLRVGSFTPKSSQSNPRSSRPQSLSLPSSESISKSPFGIPRFGDGDSVFRTPSVRRSHSKSASTSSTSSSQRASVRVREYVSRQSSGANTREASDADTDKSAGSGPLSFSTASKSKDVGQQQRTHGSRGTGVGLGLGDVPISGGPSWAPDRDTGQRGFSDPPPRTDVGDPNPRSGPVDGARVASMASVNSSGTTRVVSGVTSRSVSTASVGVGDASEGWRNEPVLYQCACVASFDPIPLGDKRYRGLPFLAMTPGDLFDIFHEVGRIDELPRFPWVEIGVDNDGVLVGRGEDGRIGLLICSFLEPLLD